MDDNDDSKKLDKFLECNQPSKRVLWAIAFVGLIILINVGISVYLLTQ